MFPESIHVSEIWSSGVVRIMGGSGMYFIGNGITGLFYLLPSSDDFLSFPITII